uniref:DUF3102 domain-containing protein n=1 Tax=uncultured bacterium Contig643 TaxID=1393602 RepID=W0FH83_9BACT|nr:hypothetical protein [uncultured bacterium Contig643]
MQSEGMNAIDVTYQTEINIENKSIEQLTAEVNVRYRQAESLANMSAMMLADAGRRLIEIKSRVGHGNFGEWCKDNLDFSQTKAARMMDLARKVDDENSLFSNFATLQNIGISTVWALLAAPEEVAAEVIETNDVESMTVRELKAELARVKEEKQEAERRADSIDHNNDDLRKEISHLQGKLAESVSEEEFNEMQAAAQTQKEDLTKELQEAQSAAADIQTKLDKAKEDLKKAKAKQKELEATKDEEVKKAVEGKTAEIEEKAEARARESSQELLDRTQRQVKDLQEHIAKLEAEKAKLSNTSLMEFKVYVDQLQDIYFKICDIITEENIRDEETGAKMQTALQKVIGGWRP